MSEILKVESKPCCTLCGSKGVLLYTGLSDVLFGAPGRWSLYKCPEPDCGLIWLNPAPLPEEIGKAYSHYYTHNSDQESRARKLVKQAYLSLEWLLSWTSLGRARKRMKYLYLDDRFAGRLLDVGCGDGLYMNTMAARGWKVEGIDFDESAVKRACEMYGLTVRQCGIREANYPDDAFDAVTLRHVIEHLFDPLETLKEGLRILRPGGTLVVVTPNSECLGHGLAHECWRGLEVPRHQNIFSLTSLKRCACKLGLSEKQYTAFTVATGADFILDESLALMEKHQQQSGLLGMRKRRLSFARTLKAICLQYREQYSLRRDPSIGEEGVLILQKK